MILQCPSNEVLGKYAIGDLDDDASDDIERHLATCPACEDSVARFDSTEDSLMRHLPLAARQASAEVQDSPGWLSQLREGVVERRGVPAESPGNVTAVGPQAVFSAYELLGILGRGGMGIVYQARHRQLHRLVALKVLSPRFIATSEARRRFEREIRILGSLHHPGIVMATDANRIDGAAYLVMELIDGVDLARMVRDGGPLSVSEACEAGRQIADALAAAHQAETVHRDIKPSNVMVDRHGRIKLLDFGLAHLAELSTDSLETSLGRLLGTLDYMAPEQADSARPLDARVDLFGLGATLFFLLTGRPPHGDHSRGSLLKQLRAIAVDDPPRVRTLRADVPQDLDDFIARLLNRDPAARPASAESVATTLSTWAGGNLAARVAELRPNGAEVPGPDMGEIAHRSLSQLLRTGVVTPEEEIAIAPPSRMRPRTSRQIPRRAAWVLGTIALVGAMLFGVTIFVTTPDGTLKIESEVESVRVDLLDDKDETHPLEIHRGANESTLRAGRYRVRLAGEHDGIAINQDVITLKRGAQTMARITRTPATGNEPIAARTPAESTNPLYQGAPESEWQQIFARETSPTAKLDQAVALITLAAELPPKAQIQKILDVGAEIVHASFGEQVIDFALIDATGPPTEAPRWQIKKGADTSLLLSSRSRFRGEGSRRRTFRQEVPAADAVVTREDLYSAYQRFQDLVNHEVNNLPAEPLAVELSAALRQGAGPRAAFAASLLRRPARGVIQANANASQVVLRELDVPLKGIDWSAVCLLVRALYSENASADQVQKMAAGLAALGATLGAVPVASTSERMKSDLLEAVNVEAKGGWPTAVRKAGANLMLERVVRDHRSFYAAASLQVYSLGGATGSLSNLQARTIYDPQYVAQVRARLPRCFDQWLVVANGYLAQHAAPPFEPAVREIVESMGLALLLYSDGDNWPGDESVALLKRQLRAFYSDNSQNTIDQPVDALLPASPAMLLTQIARGTGEIPDFVKKGHLRSRPVAAMLKRFEIAIRAGELRLIPPELSQMRPSAKEPLVDAPYEVIRLAVEPRPANERKVGQGGYNPFAPQQIIPAASRQSMDPLLYLAVLTDLTGNSPAQDDRIAELVSHWTQGTDVRLGLEHLLASRLKAREQARRLLQKMAANAKSPQLSNAMRELNATLLAAKP